MAIFVDQNTKVIVQGLTGGQGRFHGLRNKAYGTQVVGGVTPGKAGQDVEGIPVFDSVADAVAATGANASFIAVPPKAAPAAILEAARAGIGFVVCITEGVPAQDEARVFAHCNAIIPPRGCLAQTVQELLVRVNAILELLLAKLRNYQVRVDQTLELFLVLELSRTKRYTN